MVRLKKEKKKRPDFAIPKGIVLLSTPEGWRTGVLSTEGGMLCGRLDVPINSAPQDARAEAAVMVTELARDFHENRGRGGLGSAPGAFVIDRPRHPR